MYVIFFKYIPTYIHTNKYVIFFQSEGMKVFKENQIMYIMGINKKVYKMEVMKLIFYKVQSGGVKLTIVGENIHRH